MFVNLPDALEDIRKAIDAIPDTKDEARTAKLLKKILAGQRTIDTRLDTIEANTGRILKKILVGQRTIDARLEAIEANRAGQRTIDTRLKAIEAALTVPTQRKTEPSNTVPFQIEPFQTEPFADELFVKRCKEMVKSGPRKGETCRYSARQGTDICALHTTKRDAATAFGADAAAPRPVKRSTPYPKSPMTITGPSQVPSGQPPCGLCNTVMWARQTCVSFGACGCKFHTECAEKWRAAGDPGCPMHTDVSKS